MAFGKIKRLISKKGPTGSPSASTPDTLKPTTVDFVASTDVTEIKTNGAASPTRQKGAGRTGAEDRVPLLSGDLTDADDVLDGILQDLNITQLAVDAEKTDTVSEFSGGSAKSVEGESEEDDEETDEDEEVTDEEEDEDNDDDEEEEEEEEKVEDFQPAAPAGKGRRSSVGDRVAAVVAAAEEIRKKRAHTPVSSHAAASGKATPASASSGGRLTPMGEQPPASRGSRGSSREGTLAGSRSGGNSRTSKQQEQGSRTASKSGNSKTSGLREQSSSRSHIPRPKVRSSTPQFSPEVKPHVGSHGNSATGATKSFEDDNNTKDTQDVSDEGTYDEGTYDEDDTIGENTVGTDDRSYEDKKAAVLRQPNNSISTSESQSQNEPSTFDEDEQRRMTKKTVMNKDIIIHQPGGPSSLVVRAMYYTPLPANPEDIIIKVEASTVSFRDCLLRRGIGVDKIPFPFVPGCEVVGTVSNVGKAARLEGYRIGDRVVGITRRGGGNGYYAKFTTRNVAPVLSTTIDAAEAVCLVDVYMTAYQALRVGKKDGTPLTEANILITDGYSPVGQAAVALAKLEGANVYVTTTESRQDEYMKTLGVKCLPLAPSKWLHKLKGKMDVVIDNTCFDSYDSSWKALNSNGILVCTGMTSIYSFHEHSTTGGCGGCEAFGDLRDYQAKWAAIKAKYMMSQTKFHDLWESFQKNPKRFQQELKYLCFLVESQMLKPKIAERVSIEEVPDAQRYLETGKANGTIVCLP